MTLELTSLKQLRDTIAQWQAAGDSIALVPTMGALHRGHLTLVEQAKTHAKRVVVSIFVNPTQFGPNEDFDRYPRPREHDLMLLREEGVDAAWLPTVEEMYPEGAASTLKAGSAARGLDGDARPGHFDGVVTVVARLLAQVTPDIALFGEKDYQQLCVIKQMVADQRLPVQIIGVPTVREPSGLALSSRNQYLSKEEHDIAPVLYKTLTEVAAQIKNYAVVNEALANATAQLLEAGFLKIDYLELHAEDTLAPLATLNQPARLLVAAWLGKTRLIDNVRVDYAER